VIIPLMRPIIALLLFIVCSVAFAQIDSDGVDLDVAYVPKLSQLQWVAPSRRLPPDVRYKAANNNVGIVLHDERLFMAWRTAKNHFASKGTKLIVISSGDLGKVWEHETTLQLGADVREPVFLSFKGKLFLHFFEAGTNPLKFEPRRLLRIERLPDGKWSAPEEFGERGEIVWDMKVRDGKAWKSSYIGNHYGGGLGGVELHFEASDDGLSWRPVPGYATSQVFQGGASEASFEFDLDGKLWAVTRNEDGDHTGFGAHIVSAAKDRYGDWDFPSKSDPRRYDSPRLFRHGREIYMIARRDVGGVFDWGYRFLPPSLRKWALLGAYSLRPKKTTLYWLDRNTRKAVPLADLPSAGDTAFPSIERLGPNRFLIANYSSPLDRPGISWIKGQTSKRGTGIYLITLDFVPETR